MPNPNDDLPSSADAIASRHDATTDDTSVSQKVDEALKATEEFLAGAKERSARAYEKSNAALAEHIDPLPGMFLAAAAGFMLGCIWASTRD